MAENNTLFLEQQSYRQRRVRDVAKILPILGALLWTLPLLWPQSGEEIAMTGSALQFMFIAWIVLIILSAIVARLIRSETDEQTGRS